MAIRVQNQTFYLETKNSLYQMQVDQFGVLIHLWYGEKTAMDMTYLLEYPDPVLKVMYDSFREIPAIRDAKCRLGDNGGSKDETFREIEWYIFSEAAYRFADLAKEQGEPDGYLEELEAFAKKFEYDEFWNIFLEDKNLFDYTPQAGQNTDFFHAYSHLNSFHSAMYIYWRTGDEKYLEMTKKFWEFMNGTQKVATGGYGTILEWLLPKDRMIDALQHCHATFENQCNTYATVRLNRTLSLVTGSLRYGSWSELLYYNSFFL
ncbi:MAG: glycoside hydrolase family 127 protein [Faecalimonas sp.]|nr:glycoside hydrolase family 127 protein [Faecalimonas sp.]